MPCGHYLRLVVFSKGSGEFANFIDPSVRSVVSRHDHHSDRIGIDEYRSLKFFKYRVESAHSSCLIQ